MVRGHLHALLPRSKSFSFQMSFATAALCWASSTAYVQPGIVPKTHALPHRHQAPRVVFRRGGEDAQALRQARGLADPRPQAPRGGAARLARIAARLRPVQRSSSSIMQRLSGVEPGMLGWGSREIEWAIRQGLFGQGHRLGPRATAFQRQLRLRMAS